MKTKYIIAALLCWFAFSATNATPASVDEKKMAAPSAGKSSGGIYSNYGILGEPSVGLQNNGNSNNYVGYLRGLDFSIVITTDAVVGTSGTPSSATCYCSISDDAGYTINTRGVCRNSVGNPVLTNNPVACGSGNGNYSAAISGLTPGATYYFRAYATTTLGDTVYGNQLTFTSIPTLGEWGLIAFGAIIAIVGGAIVWKKFV